MRIFAAVLALLPAVAAAGEDGRREALLTALAMNDCAVTEDETATLFGAQGFDPEYVRQELGRMLLDDTAFLEGGRILRVTAEHCPPVEPVPTPAQAFRQQIVENGCSIDDHGARELGVDPAWMRPVVGRWIKSGTATLDWRTLTLRDCQ